MISGLSAERELGEIFDRAARAAAEPSAPPLDRLSPVVLYGAGVVGRRVLAQLRAAGIEPIAFADDTPSKQGTSLDGLTIVSPAAAADRFGPRFTFVVTILNAASRFVDARARLSSIAPDARVVSFLHATRAAFTPAALAGSAPEILDAFALLNDEESRRQFVDHIGFRLTLDYDALPPRGDGGYFPPDVVPEFGPDADFIDGGAYDGDSIRAFLAHQRGRFRRIDAFEPDPENCARLRASVAGLPGDVSSRIFVHEAALDRCRGRARFRQTGDMSAACSDTGTIEVDAVAIDEIVEPRVGAYLKLDVEGAERRALDGAASLIASARPALAISVYHHPADLWTLPLHVKRMAGGYRFFLRTQGEDGQDLICFAIPGRG